MPMKHRQGNVQISTCNHVVDYSSPGLVEQKNDPQTQRSSPDHFKCETMGVSMVSSSMINKLRLWELKRKESVN